MKFGPPIRECEHAVSGDKGGYHKIMRTRLGRFRIDFFEGRSVPFLATGPHALNAQVATEAEAVAAVRRHIAEIRDQLSAMLNEETL